MIIPLKFKHTHLHRSTTIHVYQCIVCRWNNLYVVAYLPADTFKQRQINEKPPKTSIMKKKYMKQGNISISYETQYVKIKCA